VPITSFACASFATAQAGFHQDIWIAAGMVGLGGVISGTVLAGVSFARTDQAREQTPFALKPEFADDAYDVVSSRG